MKRNSLNDEEIAALVRYFKILAEIEHDTTTDTTEENAIIISEETEGKTV